MPSPVPTLTTTSPALALVVPYFSQNDSTTAQGPRMCFSSTCAMAAAHLRPGCLPGAGQADDRYLQRVLRHGDSTNASAQVAALAELGITARFRCDGRIEHLIAQLQRGIPIPVGWRPRRGAAIGAGSSALTPSARRCSTTTPTARPTCCTAAT